MRQAGVFLSKIAFIMVLAGNLSCAPEPPAQHAADAISAEPTLAYEPLHDPLNNSSWVLITLRGNRPVEGSILTIKFSEGRWDGMTGCNHIYGGDPFTTPYEITEDGELRIPGFMITLLPCVDAAGASPEKTQQEETYTAALLSVASYRLGENQLELQDHNGETILVFVREETP